ncbi:hypothetical protein KIH24_01135 [Rhizobiales bacterium TNE-4]|nr:hypothetical protein [Rhizobiales bacterium TNE-4]MBV1826220.1 hypothetical protein [Rhizobiales bacterium TNE-4]
MSGKMTFDKLITVGLVAFVFSSAACAQSIGSQLTEELKNSRGSNSGPVVRDTPEKMQGREINRAARDANEKARGAARPIHAKVRVNYTISCTNSANLGFPAFEKQYELQLKNGIGAIVDRYDDPKGKIVVESTSIQLTRDGRLMVSSRGRTFDRTYSYYRKLTGAADPNLSEISSTGQQFVSNVRDRVCSAVLTLGDNIKIAEVIDAPRVEAQKVQADLDAGLARVEDEVRKTQADLQKFKDSTISVFQNILLPLTENPKDWMMRVSSVPVQQQQFCRIIDRFFDELDDISATKNEIKKRIAYRDRINDISALLPKGRFENWVVRVLGIKLLKDGSAAVILQPPCRAVIGTDMCLNNSDVISGAVKADSSMYRELAKVSAGDFVVVSGSIVAVESDSSNTAQTIPALYEPGKNCADSDIVKKQDYFVSQLSYLAALK